MKEKGSTVALNAICVVFLPPKNPQLMIKMDRLFGDDLWGA
jgi:hypothetical protein